VWTLYCVKTLKTYPKALAVDTWKLMCICICSFPERHRNYKYHWWSWDSGLQLI
jgi:hypothetical protein